MNLEYAAEAALTFIVVEGAGFAVNGITGAQGALPLAIASAAVIYKTGISVSDLKQIVIDIANVLEGNPPATPPPATDPAGQILTPATLAIVSGLKSIGDFVFLNPNQPQGIVYRYLGIWYDVNGTVLSNGVDNPPAGTGAQL